MSDIELNEWRLTNEVVQPRPTTKRAPQVKRGQHFLCGPIPIPWLSVAMKLPGKALHVAIAVWYLSGLSKGAAKVHLSPTLVRKLGVQRHTAYRALLALEKAGLVSVVRHRGKAAQVTILDPTENRAAYPSV